MQSKDSRQRFQIQALGANLAALCFDVWGVFLQGGGLRAKGEHVDGLFQQPGMDRDGLWLCHFPPHRRKCSPSFRLNMFVHGVLLSS